jgi:hypothetical protein
VVADGTTEETGVEQSGQVVSLQFTEYGAQLRS